MSFDMADSLLDDLRARTDSLEALEHPVPAGASGAKDVFAH